MSFVDKFVDWAHQCLLGSDIAQEYLMGRGVSQSQWARYKLGYIGGDYDVLPEEDKNHNPEVCENKDTRHRRCDACHYRSWSSVWENGKLIVGRRLLDSIVLPLVSYAGQTVGFQVRSRLKKDYDTFALGRRPEGYFFGVSQALESIWHSHEVFVVETPFDQLLFERLVAPNVVSITTNQPGLSHVRFFQRFVRTVNLCLDLDKAGREGAAKFIDRYSTEFQIRNMKYPKLKSEHKDPGDYWKVVGDEKFSHYFKEMIRSF